MPTSDLVSVNQTVVGIQNNPVSATSPTTGQVLEWNGTTWIPTNLPSSLPPSGSAGGDLGGSYPNPSVSHINGTSVPATPSANQVLVATSGTAATWEQISDAQVSSSAAIEYSKLNLTGSLVNADISSSAAIDGSKISANFSAQTTILGGVRYAVSSLKTANYTATTSDYLIGIGTLTSAITITLPASPTTGNAYAVKDVNGSCSTINTITVSGNGNNIDGSATFLIETGYNSFEFVFTGSQWSVL